ncbi:hypothetical protein CXG81DRAFT_13059 [Caulochytrium protostelioides]|uniref:DUF1394-domain-containing protein n=1 Tax=Caulochytrium protostelioides TaxID=1555241 RepID=A0A4P9WYW4_9FUNG|nr:DUF1394-domain-containing protein [Caulochytrium protostelioides]RKP00579.1 hypothetical protein CXG81DRAFT_13059 [Caulochytrium protostelioides]|eukprot:RKP00579.1 hypothetical protein CXG81DRAFT_13059 [Caulochytrium protostelioides]
MGVLLSLLKGTAGGADDYPCHVPIDLLAARPCESEQATYDAVTALLAPAQEHLCALQSYAGCGEAIRAAISTPSRDTEEAAWNAVSPAVLTLKAFYEFALQLEAAVPSLLTFFCADAAAHPSAPGSDAPAIAAALERNAATAKRLADVLWFISRFDELKMGNPNIQNDFSYYRRTLSRMRMASAAGQPAAGAPGGATCPVVVVQDELANRMSLFYAHATPMTKAVIDSVNRLAQTPGSKVSNDEITDVLSLIGGVCYHAAQDPAPAAGDVSFTMNTSPGEYFLRVIVVCMIMYDHISPVGVFNKGGKINVRASVRVIQGADNAQNLMNTLRYTTIHLNDETTPKSIKTLLAA